MLGQEGCREFRSDDTLPECDSLACDLELEQAFFEPCEQKNAMVVV